MKGDASPFMGATPPNPSPTFISNHLLKIILNISNSVQTREVLPLILIRGFGDTDITDEQKNAYQGFNEGTVYPLKQGENYIYEGFILRLMKSN